MQLAEDKMLEKTKRDEYLPHVVEYVPHVVDQVVDHVSWLADQVTQQSNQRSISALFVLAIIINH